MRTTLNKAFVAAQAYPNAAQAALTERLAARPIDAEQRAAHGFARVATTAAALEAVLASLAPGDDSTTHDANIATPPFLRAIVPIVVRPPIGHYAILSLTRHFHRHP